jgi:hypothetical protein
MPTFIWLRNNFKHVETEDDEYDNCAFFHSSDFISCTAFHTLLLFTILINFYVNDNVSEPSWLSFIIMCMLLFILSFVLVLSRC